MLLHAAQVLFVKGKDNHFDPLLKSNAGISPGMY